MSKIDHSLFKADEHALEEAYGLCPDCNQKLQLKRSKAGPFIGCSAYPSCEFTKPLHENETSQLKLIEGSSCKKCASQLAIKKGRFGLFIGCTNFPECDFIESIKQQDKTNLACPECNNGSLLKRANKYGKSFYACDQFPKCKYAVNFPPVDSSCPKCGWTIMLEKKMADGLRWICPQKHCNHKTEPTG